MATRGQKKSKRARRLKREKRKKNRVAKVIQHFTECDRRSLNIAPGGRFAFDQDGMHVEMRCKQCQLKLVRHNESGEYEVKDVGRFSWDATVLDLLTL